MKQPSNLPSEQRAESPAQPRDSDQRSAGKRVEDSDAQLRLITDAMPALIAYVDREERYRFNNKAYEQWFGYPPRTILGKTLQEVVGEAAYQAIKPHLDAALAGRRVDYESVVPYRDAGVRHIQATYIPHVGKDGEVLGFYSLVTDITDRKAAELAGKAAEEKLRESERRYRTLAEALTETTAMLGRERERLSVALRTGALGVYEWRVGDEAVWWSPETYPLYGVDPASFTPTVEALSALIHPDDRDEFWRKTRQSVEAREAFNHEYRIVRPDGVARWILNHSDVGLDAEQRVERITGVAADITDRKKAEEDLERLVAERTHALYRSNEDLQQFAHVASHDLKEPVRKVKMFSSRLRDELQGVVSERAFTYLEKIESAADRMSAMIDGVLLYSSMDGVERAANRIDLDEVVQQIVADLEVLIQQKNAVVEFSGLPVVEGADILIYQLFFNLINNSLKFSQSDRPPRIIITAHTPTTAEIEALGLSPARRYSTITLSDNGIGFDQAYAEKIFETFARLHSRDRFEGTGLGLALCRKIVERHGGTIRAFGQEGAGARFEITLPSLAR